MSKSKEQLVDSFKELYSIEKRAHNFYEEQLATKLTDHGREIIQKIHDDEERHMKIVAEILTIIESSK